MFLDLEPVLSRRKENAATNLAGAHWEDAIIPRAELLIITQHDWPTKWKSGIISKTAISIKKSTRKIHWTHITLAYTHTSIYIYIHQNKQISHVIQKTKTWRQFEHVSTARCDAACIFVAVFSMGDSDLVRALQDVDMWMDSCDGQFQPTDKGI